MFASLDQRLFWGGKSIFFPAEIRRAMCARIVIGADSLGNSNI